MTKYARIKELMETGREVDMQELCSISMRYGSVLHRLRHEQGYIIETIAVDRATGHFRYRMSERPLFRLESAGRTDAVMPVSLSCGGAG